VWGGVVCSAFLGADANPAESEKKTRPERRQQPLPEILKEKARPPLRSLAQEKKTAPIDRTSERTQTQHFYSPGRCLLILEDSFEW